MIRDQSENCSSQPPFSQISFITKRPSNIFFDEDHLEGQEFYTEIRTKNSKHWTLKRIAKRHLSHVEFIKLKKPSLHWDCYRVMVPVAELPCRAGT